MVKRIWLGFVVAAMSTGMAAHAQTLSLTPGTGQSTPAISTGTLAGLIAELERNNPELQAAKSEWDARVARVAPAGALPDPTLSVSTMTGFSRPPFFPATATPNAFNQVGIAQAFPYPGKRDLRASIAKSDVAAAQWDYDDRRRVLIAELKVACLDLVLLGRSLEIVRENKALVAQLREAAEARFSVGKGLQQDVIKAQVEQSMLIERQTLLEQQRAVTAARLNALLFRPVDAPVPAILAYTVEPLPADLMSLRLRVSTDYVALRREDALVEKGRQQVVLNRKELRPDFQVGIIAQRYSGDMPWMYGFEFMVGLPLYSAQKQRPMIAEATANLTGRERLRDAVRTQAMSEVTEAVLTATAADRLITLYTDSVLPQAQLSLESSLAAYQSGTVDFLSVLTGFDAVFAAQTSRLEQQIRRDQALVRLEPYVGLEFVK